jgi:hypothetical protein
MRSKAQTIIIAVVIMVLAAAFAATILSLFGIDLGGSLHYVRSQQALFIAEGGLEYYLEQLENQQASWVTPPTQPVDAALGLGTFTITVSNAQADSIDVTSTGTISGMDGITIVRVVSVTAKRVPAVTPAFSFLLRGNSPGGVNFTNSLGTVTGDLSSAGNITGIPAFGLTLNGTKYPDSDLDFPTVDYASYQAIANQVISGNFTFATNTTYNGIYYITGNVTFQSGAKLYGTLVMPTANKTVSLDNSVGVVIDPSVDPLHPSGSYPAIVSAGRISATSTNNLHIKRLVYTDRNANPSINFRYSVGLDFDGTIVSQGGVDVRNNTGLNMAFDANILTNPPPGFSGGTQRVADSLWDEVY